MRFYKPSYFAAIVEEGSLTKAAQKLYISQPSLSQYLKRLEDILGVQLFDHKTSPLQLTYVGKRYYEYVLQFMKLDEHVRKEFQDIENQLSGQLRLGIAFWRGACLLPDVFPHFHEQYPDIHIELTEGRSAQLENALMNDKIDIAIMNHPYTLDYNKLTCETIFEERILLAAPSIHPFVQKTLAGGEQLGPYPLATLDLLKSIPLILTKPGQNLTYAVNRALAKSHVEPDVLMETGNLTTAINLTATGIACTFVPEEGVKMCSHPGQVTFFAVDTPELIWTLEAVYQKDTYLTEISRLFIQELKRSLERF